MATKSAEKKIIHDLEQHFKKINANGTPKWLRDYRQRSFEQFQSQDFPTTKHEEWKYTNIAPILRKTYRFPQKFALKERQALDSYLDSSEINIVFVNGQLDEEISQLDNLPKGLTVQPLAEAVNAKGGLGEKLEKLTNDDDSIFTWLNNALLQRGIYVEIDASAHVEELVHIVHVTSDPGDDVYSTPRSLIVANKSCEATVLESHVAFDDSLVYFANALTDIYVAENAILRYTKAQKESFAGYHIGQTRVFQEKNSVFDSLSFAAGSLISRNNFDVTLDGEGADTTINGLYSLFGKQHCDNHTSVEHRVPNCTSNQLYKGLLNESARAVFNGKIFVRSLAQQTSSYQLNKNLLLGKDCRVDTKPQLEIFADDVKCTHGATIGQLDKDEMFYLQTRAIPKKEAVKVLSKGFIDDLLNELKSESVNKKLHVLLEPSFAHL